MIFVSLDADPDRNATPINPALELLDSGGAVLIAVNDSGSTSNNTASPGTLTGSNPSSPSEGLVWRARVSGTYFVRVTIGTTSTGATGTGNYLLSISRNCAVGASTGVTISGSVDYGITDCDPSTLEGRPVPGVTLTGIGALTRNTVTGAPGTYSLTGLAKDSDYTVIPSKTGDVNGISTTDATRILQELTTPGTINSCQSQAGDATNNGGLSTTDATRLLQFLSGTPVAGNTTGTWKFIPASRSYTPLAVDQTNQHYEALLIGDVTGNWAPPALRSQGVRTPTGGIPVTIPDAAQDPGQTITIPILVPNLTGQGVEGFQFTLTFNPAILDFLNSDTTGTISAGSLVSENESPPGTVNLAAARATPYTGAGTLINLVFMVQPGATLGQTTTLQFTLFNFGEGPAADFSDTGLFTVSQIPTAVKLSGFTATGYDGGVFLQWRTGFEVSNLGFNIYRAEKRGLTRINPDVLAGSALVTGAAPLTAGRSYDWFDNTAPNKRGTLYYVEDIALDGTRTLHGPIAPVMVGGDPPERSRPALLSQLGKGSEPIISYPAFVSPDAAPGRFNAPGLMAAGKAIPVNTVELAGMAAVKASVRERGWYRITQPQLLAAGLAAGTDPRMLQLYADGAELPMRVLGELDGSFDSVDALEFYGVGLDNAVTDTRTYWVVAGNSAGQRIQQVTGAGGQPGDKSFRFTIERKDRTIYFSALRNGEVENFFGSVVASSPVNQVLNLSNVNLMSTDEALLELSLQGVTTVGHRVRVMVNGLQVGEMEFMSQTPGFATFSIAHSLLREGANDVTLQSLNGASDLSLVNFVRLSYQHDYKADGDALQLSATGNQLISIGGFTNNQIKVIDISNPASVQELLGSVEQLKDGSYSVTLSVPAGGQRTLFAFADNRTKQASGLEANVPSSWRKSSNGADLIIITHNDFLGAAATLRAHRQRQGYAVAVINVTDLFDEMSFGNKSPLAIREFLSFAMTSWKRAPRFLLFLGDASFDPRDYLGLGNNDRVPTKLIDTYFMEASSEDFFVDPDQDGVPNIAVGRLPVRTPQDAANIVAKVIRYDQSGPFDEMLLASDADQDYSFTSMSAALLPLVPNEVRVNQLNRGEMDINTARAKLMDALNRGQKVVNYAGHGSVDQWSGNFLTVGDAQALENSDRLSIFIMMTCLNGYFNDANIDSLAEAFLRPNGGAAAVWASTGMCLPEGQALMNQEMYRQMFSIVNGKRLTLGEAAMRSKSSMPDLDVRRTWVLLGDPTTRLR